MNAKPGEFKVRYIYIYTHTILEVNLMKIYTCACSFSLFHGLFFLQNLLEIFLHTAKLGPLAFFKVSTVKNKKIFASTNTIEST